MIIGDEEVARVERVAASTSAAVAQPLARLDPGLGATSVPLAGGQLVLLGPGMYVNRGLALGFGVEVTTEDLGVLEAASEASGVPAEVEVTPRASPSLLECTVAGGYRPAGFRSTLMRPLPPDPRPPTAILSVEEVIDDVGLATWQATASEGFGYTSPEARRISDLYTTAMHSLEEFRLYVARIRGGVVGVAGLTIGDDVAILGGMTTVPSARGQGVQRELLHFRLAAAAWAGCQIAMSTAAPGSASERNLLRSGFSIVYTTLTMRRPRQDSG